MALFRRVFNRKSPDRLLEISERVYVFDCCFSTEALEEGEYKVYMGGIVTELQDYYPNSSFMVFNFREGDKRTQVSDILSQYDMTVMEYPIQYEGFRMLPLEMIHHFLRSCESWLFLADQQNVLLMHCERGGWPVLAFMLAALLLFRKQYNGEEKVLEMMYKQAPRELLRLLTPLNTQPSQLRYLQYIFSRNVGSDWLPSDTPLVLDHIVFRHLPLFDEMGSRPVIRIYGQDSSSTTAKRSSKLLFTSSKTINQPRYNPAVVHESQNNHIFKSITQIRASPLQIDIHQRVQGDVVLECIHSERVTEEMIFRVMFHTTFVRRNVLILSLDEVDYPWDARDQMPKNFRVEVYFSDAGALEDKFSYVVDGQDGLLSKEIKVDPKNGDIAPPPPPPPPSPPPSIHAATFPQIMAPFLEEFEHLKIQLEDIKLATDNFGENKVIGRGGFGKVYLGEFSHSKGKSMGAFKRLDSRLGQGEPEFWKEVLMLFDYKHENLISLLGFCNEGGERILVYEYASNGSLDRHLSSTHLTWIQRIKICLDAARGLSFLHDDKGTMQRVIHRDIKSSNILLDDNWNAKISDMGLSKIGPANQLRTFLITRNIVGTPGYCDPQYMTSYTLSKESDVYSFGVVLFEVLCGRLCCNYNNGQLNILVPTWKKAYKQNNLHEIVFQGLTRPMESTSLETFSGIAFQCLQKSRKERPTIAHVVGKLETALEFQKPPNKYEDGIKVTGRVLQGSLWEELKTPGKPQRYSTLSPTICGSPSSPPPPPPPPLPQIRRAPPPPSLPGGRPPPQMPGLSPPLGARALGPPRPPGVGSPPPPRAPDLMRTVGTTMVPHGSNLKPLHWSKVTKATHGSLWEELQRRGEPQSEFDASEIETFFSAMVPKKDTSQGGRHQSTGSKPLKVYLVDLRKASHMKFLFTKIKMPLPDLTAAALAMDESILDGYQIENLIKLYPTKEEMEILMNYTGDKEMLGECEQFFLELMKIPRMERKLGVFLFKVQLNTQLSELRMSLNIVNSACDEVRNSVKLKEIMKQILYLGNTLNQGTARGSAVGFKLDSLLKLADTRAANSKMTLMHYLCRVLATKSPDLLDFYVDLVSLESATKIQLKYLAEEVQAIIKGLEKAKGELVASENDGPVSQVFHKTLNEFVGFAEPEALSATDLYLVVNRKADELALYFGEDPARCPFEQVTQTLLNFVRLFRKALEENYKHGEESSKRG